MPENSMHPLEAVLRRIAAVAPQPWYPRVFAQKVQFPINQLHYFVEHLWLDGLLRKGEGTPETGGGVLLSPAGEAVLRDPKLLQRLHDGEPLNPGDRGSIVRAVFRKKPRPVVTLLLLWANVLWFAWGLYLAYSRHHAAQAFLSFGDGGQAVAQVRHQTGSVAPDDLIRGQWWRLLSCTFVHVGVSHIACNMFGVHIIGRMAEQMWGRGRYLAIYLLSGFGGSCVALAFKPTGLAGASGALCGIFGAELVWLLLNGRYLPRRAVRLWWSGIGVNLLLLAGFSALANVSALGHFGGLAFGAVAALLLNVQRFGRSVWRWAALLPLIALPWLGVEMIQRQRVVNDGWHHVEDRVFAQDVLSRWPKAVVAFRQGMSSAPNVSAEKQLEAVVHARTLLTELDRELARPGWSLSKDTEELRRNRQTLVAELLKTIAEKEEKLR